MLSWSHSDRKHESDHSLQSAPVASVANTTTTQFLLQLDTEKLKCLQPGSVRLTTKLAHMGFVHRALQDFNQRSVDGLLPSVVVVPITVEGEKQDVWISWTDVDGYDGLAGGWRAGKGKVVTRKRRA